MNSCFNYKPNHLSLSIFQDFKANITQICLKLYFRAIGVLEDVIKAIRFVINLWY